MYDPDGEWFKEGYGVEPDIEIDDDPTIMAKGGDPQLDKAIEYVTDELKKGTPPSVLKQPKYEKR
jgi:tricorn protease